MKLSEQDEKLIYNLKYYPGEKRHEDKLRKCLERGRNAIEFVENVKIIAKITNDGTVRQDGAIKAIIILLQEYEATDGN